MNAPNRDIASRADVVQLVDGFYARVRADEVLGPIFDGIAHAVLFGASGFQGKPLAVHRELATRVPLGVIPRP